MYVYDIVNVCMILLLQIDACEDTSVRTRQDRPADIVTFLPAYPCKQPHFLQKVHLILHPP